MKFRTSGELKNMILSINLAILTFFKAFYPIFWNILGSVGMKIFLFFLEGNKNCRVGTKKKNKKNRVGRVSGNTGIFLFLFFFIFFFMPNYVTWYRGPIF